MLSLPIEQYPDIAPPTVKVNATYTGANAETIMKSVVTPLESSVNGVENMQYMTSSAANNGTCTITIYFKQGADPNMAVVNVQNRKGDDFKSLSAATRRFVDALNKRREIAKAHYTFKIDYPQYMVEVDAARCMMKGVSPKDLLDVLAAYVGGDYASNINKYTKLYRVMVQSAATGYSSGQAIRAISDVTSQTLPSGFGYELSGLSHEESSQGNATTMILATSIVFIYIILS